MCEDLRVGIRKINVILLPYPQRRDTSFVSWQSIQGDEKLVHVG